MRSSSDERAGGRRPDRFSLAVALIGVLAAAFASAAPAAPAADQIAVEAWREVPMPPGFRVVPTELDGPVFATADGMTVYTWPQHKLRNGYSGEGAGAIECRDEVLTVTAGLMSPYPPGIELPELDARPTCTDRWPPVLAEDGAEAVGEFTLLEREPGVFQWAYDEQALYHSVRDEQPGDVWGGITRRYSGDAPAYRVPAKPPALLPPGFTVRTTTVGRMLGTDRSEALYAHEGDTATSVACTGECLQRFRPVIAPALARARGEWSIVERSPGVRQWVFRGRPLYTHVLDQESWSQQGADVPGWDNVFTQRAPPPPASFTAQATISGTVLADADGRTIYVYHCGEDSADQLACDHPDTTQVYRLAMCGAGDPGRCLEHWPYVEAAPDAEGTSRTWRVVRIDPMTGRFADDDAPRALRVWAYRDRPVHLFGRDAKPGDVRGGGIGEWRGQRNGLRAFWLRNDFMRGIL